ncbi:MAG TPA: hypothetical protein DDW23_06860 [Planctomycetes bacterium]|nr:hypothetical protein [Planctomycetota bacterium]
MLHRCRCIGSGMRRLHGQIIVTYLSFLALSSCSFDSHDGWSHGMECSVCLEVRAVSGETLGATGHAHEAAYRRDSVDSFPGLLGHPSEKTLETFGGD